MPCGREFAMLVDNPILNSPFEEPTRYWAYEEGQPVLKDGRCPAGYYLKARTRGPQMALLEEEIHLTGAGQRDSRAGQSAAGTWLSRRDADHPAIAEPLEPSRARAQALLLSAGSCRDPHLTGGNLSGGKTRDRNPQGQRTYSLHLQNGNWIWQDRRHGTDHRLTGAQQAGQSAGPSLLRRSALGLSEPYHQGTIAGAFALEARQLLRKI